MDGVTGVVDGSCTDCDGSALSNCAAAACETGYHTFVDGVGCSGMVDIYCGVVCTQMQTYF
jgi:hypothetical protein